LRFKKENKCSSPTVKEGSKSRSRDMLKGVYGSEMKKLGDFGFTVDSTPRKKRKK
jgi:hypothetical protein